MQLILIDAVDLDGGHHRFNKRHHALAHVAVERIVRGKRDDSVLLELVLDLEIRLAHLDKGLGVVASSNNAAVIISE